MYNYDVNVAAVHFIIIILTNSNMDRIGFDQIKSYTEMKRMPLGEQMKVTCFEFELRFVLLLQSYSCNLFIVPLDMDDVMLTNRPLPHGCSMYCSLYAGGSRKRAC